MATQFINEFEAYRGNNENLSNVFVRVQMGSNIRYVSLSNIVEYINDSRYRHINSINEFNNLLDRQKRDEMIHLMAVDNNNNLLLGSSVDNDTEIYTRTNEIPDIYVSRDLNGVKEDGSEDRVEDGLKRAVEIKKSIGFNNSDPYVYVELSNDPNMKFLRKDQIGFYDAGRFVSFEDVVRFNRDVDLLSIIRDRDLYTIDNIYVTKIFTSSTCSVGEVKAREQIDIENLKLHSFNIEANGEINEIDLDLDTKYSEQFSYRDENQNLLDISNYEVNRQGRGDYIKVIFKGESVPTLIPISNLHFIDSTGGAGGQIDKEEFLTNPNRFVGQALIFVTEEDGETYQRELEPLTIEQTSLIFSNVRTMQVNTDANAIMKDGTYLRIKDGRYVEENKTIRPNCYEFVGFYDTDFDAYFVLFEPTSEFKGIILSKDAFKTSSSISIQGKELKLNNAIKIKLTSKPMMECDLIQTSSNNQMIESAELLNYPKLKEDGTIDYIYTGYFEKIEKDQDEKTEIIKQTNAEFVEKYKNGQYVIDKVVDDEGNLVELDQQKKRYSLSTIKTIPDPANDLQQYKYFGKDNLIYDARTGRFTGGPKYNTKAAIGREIRKGLKNLFIATASLFSLGGVFALAIAPAAVLGVFAGLVAYPIGKSIVEAIKGFRINRKNYQYTDRVDENRKHFSDEINDDLSELYSQTQDKLTQSNYDILKDYVKNQILSSSDPEIAGLKGRKLQAEIDKRIRTISEDEYKSLTRKSRAQYLGVFLDRMKKIEEKTDDFATTKFYADFRVVEGKAEVTPANAPLFSKYRQEMQALEKEIKKLRRGAKNDPIKKAELENKLREYKEKSNNYISFGKEHEKNPEFDVVTDKVYLMKGLIAFKEFGDIIEQEDEFKDYFSADEKEFISHLDYNPQKNQFTYDGKIFSTTNLMNDVISDKTQKENVPMERVLNIITQKIYNYGKALPSYEYENGNTLIKSANFEIDNETINSTNETDSIAEIQQPEVAVDNSEMAKNAHTEQPIEREHSERSIEEQSNSSNSSENTVSTKTRLNRENLETLLNRISELDKLDKMYYGPDEEMIDDIDDKIKYLEDLIRKDLHLLKSAGRSTSDRYVKYKRQIVQAEKMLKEHQIMNERRAKINVGAKI